MQRTKIFDHWQDTLINQPDFLKEMVQRCLQKAIEEQFDKFIGAEEHQRSTSRNGYRNGTYTRQLKTRVGSLTLHVCCDRDGEFRTDHLNAIKEVKEHLC